MSQYYIYLLIAVIVFGIVKGAEILMEEKESGGKAEKDPSLEFFYPKKYFFNQSEKMLYEILNKVGGDTYEVLAKVRLEDFIGVKKSNSGDTKDIKNKKYGSRSRIKSRHVDFLLLDKTTFQLVMAIELDGSSHNTSKAKEADTFKDKLFKHVNLPLHRIHVGENFEERVKELVG